MMTAAKTPQERLGDLPLSYNHSSNSLGANLRPLGLQGIPDRYPRQPYVIPAIHIVKQGKSTGQVCLTGLLLSLFCLPCHSQAIMQVGEPDKNGISFFASPTCFMVSTHWARGESMSM